MSADATCTYNQTQLLARARTITACERFTIEAGGSRHHCALCDGTEAEHIVVALLARTRERGQQ